MALPHREGSRGAELVVAAFKVGRAGADAVGGVEDVAFAEVDCCCLWWGGGGGGGGNINEKRG